MTESKFNFPKAKAWSGLLFVLSAFYLIYELAFNSRIVDGSTGDFSPEKMEALELQGRILSGIGMSLLCLKFIKLSNVKTFMISFVAVTTVAFSLMFFGQKILIEHLVDSSSKEDRLNAQYISLLKKGVMERHIILEDLSIPESAVGTPATKAMMSIIGALSFNSSDFVQKLKDNTDQIIELAASNDAKRTLPEAYGAYQDYQRGINEKWIEYISGVEKYNKELSSIQPKAEKQANLVYEEAGKEFRKETSKANNKEALIRTTLEIKRAVGDYFEAKEIADERCSKYDSIEQKCHIKIENTYRDIVIKNAGKYVPPDYWCYPKKEEKVTKSIRGRLVSNIEMTQDCSTMNREWYESKLLSLKGSNTDIGENKAVASAVRERLAEDGVIMPKTWRMSDKQSMIDKFIEHGKNKLSTEYRKKISEVAGSYIPPTLNQKEFLNLSMVQQPIKEQLNWKSNSSVPLNLDSQQFFETLHLPRYLEPMEDIRKELSFESQTFGNDENNEVKGKNYFRSIIVPPFAMSFSLFFGLLNLFSFSALLISTPTKRKKTAKLFSHAILGAIFIGYPLISSSEAVKSEAFQHFGKQVNPAVKVLSAWVIDAQPLMYPIGNWLSSIAGQDAIEEKLLSFVSHDVIANKKSTTTSENQNSEAPLKSNQLNHLDKTESAKLTPASEPVLKSKSKHLSMAPKGNYHQLSYGKDNLPSHSLELLQSVTESGESSVLVDVSPIGDPANEDWVIYDSKVMKDDVCVLGRKTSDSLYHIKSSAWRTARHGGCNNESKGERFPTLGQMMRAINRTPSYLPVIVQLHEDLTGEVYCGRYLALSEKIEKALPRKEIIWTTPSRSVLGCLSEFSSQTAYTMPKYSSDSVILNAKTHTKANRSEWKRLKLLEKGLEHQLSTVSASLISGLVEEAPFISGTLMDKRLINSSNKEELKSLQKWVLTLDENGHISSNTQ